MDMVTNSAYNTPYANSSVLTMLLLSLASQKNAPKSDNGFFTEYDYVIVGAGAAGSVVASRLTEVPCVSVLLLEAGKSPPLITDIPVLSRNFWGSDLDWSYLTVPQKHTGRGLVNRQAIWPSGKGLGGSTIFSAGIYSRCNRKNYDDWAKHGAVGWSASDTKPYFLKLEDNRDRSFLADGYHVVGGPQSVEQVKYKSETKEPILKAARQLGDKIVDSNGERQTGFFDPQEFLRDGQRCSAAKAYLVPAENRRNLNILTEAFVTKVLFQGNRATGVQFDYKGKTYVVEARKEVIVSAGTINTAQLLMLSGVGPKEELDKFKIPMIANLPVGDNFQDQSGSVLTFHLDSKIPNILQKITNSSNIQEYIKHKTGPLSETEGVTAVAFGNPDSTVDFPSYELYFAELPKEAIKATFGLKPNVYKTVFGPYEEFPLYICLSQSLQPKSRGTIRLNTTNPYDYPLIDPNYLSDPSDVKAIVAGLKKCKAIGTSEPMKKIGSTLFTTLYPGCEQYDGNDDEYFKCLAETLATAMTHQVGTAKMGDPRDPTTVVDPQLKVKGIQGLRVVDASIMPTIVSGNAIGPTLMVAEKASDMIKSTLNCRTQLPV